MKSGIDVSYCQPKADWSKCTADFAIIQLGGGYAAFKKDAWFDYHYEGATKKGIPVGAYWYARAVTEEEALREADLAIEIMKGHQFAYPIYYDIERDVQAALGKAKVSAIVRTFLARVESAGYWVGVYSFASFLKDYIDKDIRTRYAVWVASVDVQKPLYTDPYGIWQYSWKGRISGFFGGDVDLDYAYIDYPSLIKAKGLNGFSKQPDPTPAPTPDPETGFIPRLTKPEYGNKYYNTTDVGGYAVGCILGSPTQPGLNVLSNCVPYAAGRLNEIGKYGCWKYLKYPPNAENFIEKAQGEGLTISETPSLGAILVFQKGATLNSSDGAGHVAVVEKINDDGTIVTSESGYNCSTPFWTTTRNNNDGNWNGGKNYKFRGFIVNPAVSGSTPEPAPQPEPAPEPTPSDRCPYTEPTRVLKEGMDGQDVQWLQWYLKEYKLYFGDIDGKFELMTLEALLTYQYQNNLEIDGACGPATRQSLKSNLK